MKNKVQKAYEEYLAYVNSEEYLNKVCSQDKMQRMIAKHTRLTYIRSVMYSVAGLTCSVNPSLADSIKSGVFNNWVNTPAEICFIDTNWQIHPTGTLCHHCGKIHHREELTSPTINSEFYVGSWDVFVTTTKSGYELKLKKGDKLHQFKAEDFDSLCEKIYKTTGQHPNYLSEPVMIDGVPSYLTETRA